MEDKIIVHSSYYNPIEANVIKARLEDSNIPCFLTDENIVTLNGLYNQAIGGVKLNVFEKDVVQINALLADTEVGMEAEPENNENPEGEVLCEKCGSGNVSFGQATQKRFSWWVMLVSIFFMVYPFKANRCYHCYNCGHEFK